MEIAYWIIFDSHKLIYNTIAFTTLERVYRKYYKIGKYFIHFNERFLLEYEGNCIKVKTL